MKVLAVAHTKGGVGKTTIATNLAVMASRDGLKVLLVDADVQHSAMDWRSNREQDDISAIAIQKATIHKDVPAFSNYDLVIIDAGGRDGALLRSALLAADTLVIPTLPSFYDIASAVQLSEIIRECRVSKDAQNKKYEAYFLLNRVVAAANVTESAEVTLKQLVDGQDIKILASCIASRVIYNAADSGKGVIEMPNNGKAGEEMTGLWMELKPLVITVETDTAEPAQISGEARPLTVEAVI